MPATFKVREIRDGLEITVVAQQSQIAMVLSGPIAALAVSYFSHQFVRWTIAIPFGLCVGVVAFFLSKRNRTATLRVTNLEFKTEGNLGEDRVGRRDVPRANIRWLEYQDERGGGDGPYYPSGLYAELKRGTVCVLPCLNEKQTSLVIEKIYKRFPDMPWDKKTAFDGNLTTLDLHNSE